MLQICYLFMAEIKTVSVYLFIARHNPPKYPHHIYINIQGRSINIYYYIISSPRLKSRSVFLLVCCNGKFSPKDIHMALKIQ